jgi:predicted ArsR family transcriptional regulator
MFGPAPVRYDAGGGPLSAQRARVLEQLQRSMVARKVGALATELGLHTNTVREHLDALVDRGLATRQLAPAVGRGRPAWSYAAAEGHPEPDPRVRDYAGLATALAGQIARTSTAPEVDARAAGEAWGRTLAGGVLARGPAQARRRVIGLLAELGFDPEADLGGTAVRLRRCPLLDAARAHPDVVCPVHLGIVRGALAALGADPEGATLTPFAEPGACRLDLPVRARLSGA